MKKFFFGFVFSAGTGKFQKKKKFPAFVRITSGCGPRLPGG
jgi:hypothetical protein